MSKVVKTAAIVVGAVALAVAIPGVGAAIGGAIGASAATVTAVATIASATIQVASALTAPKPSASVSGSQTTFSANPDDALPLMIGRTGTAGKITYRVGFDTRDAGDNDRQSFVVTLSVGPIDAIEGQTVDQVGVTYNGSGAAVGAYSGWMWSRTQLGATPEGAALGFGTGAGTPPGWTAAHKLSGKAAATWTLRFDTKGKMFQGGVPAPMWVGRGIRCYDPTKDSTYPGGSGPHRMADPSDRAAYDAAQDTWEFTENPYLIAMRWAHGIWQRDRSNANSTYERVMGIGAPWAMIDVASFVEGRNIAAANGWKAGGIIYSTDGKWDTMKRVLQAGMGEPLALGARISCLVNTPKVSLATITVDDVVGPASVAGSLSRRDRINTITPRYRLEANNWQFLPGPPISIPEHVATDKGKRSRLQDYAFIQSTPQVATAVRYDIENAREFGPIILPLKLVWMGYKPGDCVTATLPELGLNAQTILLLNRELSPGSGIVTMTARSETAGKHPFALGQTTTPPPPPGVTAAPLVPVPADGDWTLTALPAGGQLVTPTLAITGAARANVDGIVFEYRKFDSGLPWTAAGSDAATATYREITGLRAGTAYEVAVSYTKNGITGDRRIIGPVTTATVSVEGAPGPQGVPGPAGPNGQTSYVHFAYADSSDGSANFTTGDPGGRFYVGVYVDFTPADSTNPAAYAWSLQRGANGANGIQGPPGANGLPSYVHIAYASSADGTVNFDVSDPTGRTYIGVYSDQTLADSTNPAAYTWSLIKGADGAPGLQGPQGVPGTNGTNGANGAPGANGQTSYVHFAYADSPDGYANFTTGAADGRFYVGVYVDFYEPDSGNPASYTWSLQRGSNGANGIQGPPGANGQTTYVHVAYAGSADGSINFSVDDPAGRTYIGVRTDYVLADSGNYQDYTWSLIKGADGAPGAQGPTGATGAQGNAGAPGAPGAAGADGFVPIAVPPAFVIPAFASGAPKPSWTGGSCVIRLEKGGQRITAGVAYAYHTAENVTGLSISGDTVTFTSVSGDKGSFFVRATFNGVAYDQKVSVTKVLDGSAAFSGATPFSGTNSIDAASDMAVPAGRACVVSAAADYYVTDAAVRDYRPTLDLYWRNVTDGGGWQLLGSVNGTVATARNEGSAQEPSWVYVNGSVSGAFGFTSPSPAKQIAYRAVINRTAGTGNAQVGGSVTLEVK